MRNLTPWLMLLIGYWVHAQPFPADLCRETNLRKDLRIFRAVLQEAHPNLYRFTSKEKFESALDSVELAITDNT
ncbi:MAG: hypothetical protein ACOYXT_06920, partial [Bacteroidota bacterium]